MGTRELPRTVGIHLRPDALLYKLRDELAVERGMPPQMGRWDFYGTGDEVAAMKASDGDPLEDSQGLSLEDALYDELPGVYAARLKELVDGDLRMSKALTNKRDMRKVGGPGIEFDLVRLVVESTALAGGYLVWKEVAKDVRAAIARLRRVSGDHVLVDEGAAIVLAVDALAPPETPATLEVRFVAPLALPDDLTWAPARGYLVGLEVDDRVSVVAIDPDGAVKGMTVMEGIDLPGMGL